MGLRIKDILLQLTTSRRGRRSLVCSLRMESDSSTHDLTKRSTDCECNMKLTYKTLQLTTSRRGRRKFIGNLTDANESSTHDLTKRSTRTGVYNPSHVDSSTHDLTKRSTECCFVDDKDDASSTHDLTKRSTVFVPRNTTFYILQLTTSRRGRRQIYTIFSNHFVMILFITYKKAVQLYFLIPPPHYLAIYFLHFQCESP